MQLIKFLGWILCVSAFSSTTTFAADRGAGKSTFPPERRAETMEERKPSLAIFGGFTDTADGRKNGGAYGLEAAAQPIIPFSVAVELSGYSTASTNDQAALTRTRLLAKGNYNFGGDIPVIKYSYVGLGLGPVMDNVNHAVTIDLGVAPQLGFDIPLGDRTYSVGANANYMWVGGAKPSVFSLNGVLKYWY